MQIVFVCVRRYIVKSLNLPIGRCAIYIYIRVYIFPMFSSTRVPIHPEYTKYILTIARGYIILYRYHECPDEPNLT